MDRVVIFGSSRGLGAALRQHVEAQHIPVAGWSRVNGDLSTDKGQAFALEFLLSEPASKVFCVAGGGPYGPYHSQPWSAHEWALQVSFIFPAKVLHVLAARAVKPQVVLIGSSVAEAAADPKAASYCAAKHALRGLFYTVKSEYPDWDLRLFSPGYIDTQLLPKNAPVRRAGVYNPAQLAQELWSWTLTNDPAGHKMYAKHPEA
jgi:NAD(P)-dependent dehydrogenase (short-subunit alcohol dehydrogenase family)